MNSIYEFGPFRLEVRERRLSSKGKPIPLRPKVFDTLCALVERHGGLVGKDELIKLVWPETVVEENNLALNITMLRKALDGADPQGKWIETVTGKGYRFRHDVRRLTDGPHPSGTPAVPLENAEPERAKPALLERDGEIQELRECLRLALLAQRQFVCVTGEAGIGKTALLDAFLKEQRSGGMPLLIGKGQCVERSGEGEPYMPVLEAIGSLCRGARGAEITEMVMRHAPSWMMQLPSLVEPGALPALRERVLGVTRDRMLREFAELAEAIAHRYPLIMVLEDLHWADPSTIELISALARRRENARFLLIGSNRGGDAGASGRALEALTEELQLGGQCCLISPGRLSAAAIAQLVTARAPDSVANSELASLICERTAGNPLFAHALIDYWISRGAGSALPQGVPGSLAAMIQRKLQRLEEQDEEILACASVSGVTFSCAVIAGVLEKDEEEIEIRCSNLVEDRAILRTNGLVEWPDGSVSSSFSFAHSLFQEVLYQQIPPSRKARLHRRTAERLEEKLGQAAAQRAAEFAHHFLEGRAPERALVYMQAAAEGALQRNAPREAAIHLRRGLSLIKSLPDTPENQEREFRMLAMFAPTVIATEGFSAPEAEATYQRAVELGQRLGGMQRAYPVLLGQAFMHELRGEYYRTEELLDRHLKTTEQNSTAAAHASSLMACSLFHQGKFTGALERAEQGLGIYDPERDRDILAPYGENPSLACQAWAALCLWFLGFPDRAAERALRLVSFGETPNHRFALSTATMYAMHVYQLRRDRQEAFRLADVTLSLAEAQGYLYNVAFAKVVKGWTSVESGAAEPGLALIQSGLTLASAIGAKLDQPYLLALSAEAHMRCHQHSAALTSVTEALSLVKASRAFFYEAELYRLRAAVGLENKTRNAAAEAMKDLKIALDLAHRQGARSLELRIAIDLARVMASEGKSRAARKLLAPLHASFEEGFGTEDLKQASNLLTELAP